jgi:hypothetical protein
MFFENSTLDIEWDLVVVYEGVKAKREIKYKEGGLIFISGEPPWSRVYSKKFLGQFDELITTHAKLKHKNNHLSQPCINWHFGLSYETLKYKYDFHALQIMQPPIKTKLISIITSNQLMMPGHLKRMNFIREIKKLYPNEIDVFGKGIQPIDDKADALLPYRFNICLENSSLNHYWTEKFGDPLLAYTIPIYFGCTNITSYFNPNSFYSLDLENTDKSIKLIKQILSKPDLAYLNKLDCLQVDRQKLLNEYNLIPTLVNKFQYILNKIERQVLTTVITPSTQTNCYKILNYKLRLKRYAYKIYHSKLKHKII